MVMLFCLNTFRIALDASNLKSRTKIITACKRSFGQGNAFTPICLSTGGRGVMMSLPVIDSTPPPRTAASPPRSTSWRCASYWNLDNSTFSRTHKVGYNGINANCVFPHSCSFLHYLYLKMLVNAKLDVSWLKRLPFKVAVFFIICISKC